MEKEKKILDLTILFLFCVDAGKRVKNFYKIHLIFTAFNLNIDQIAVIENAIKERFIKPQSKDDASLGGQYALSDKGIDVIKSTDLNELIDRLSLYFPLNRENIVKFLNA